MSYRKYLESFSCAATGAIACRDDTTTTTDEEAAAALGVADGLAAKADPYEVAKSGLPKTKAEVGSALSRLLSSEGCSRLG